MDFSVAFLTIGFLGLISSMMVFLASYTERKFYHLLRDIYLLWEDERRDLTIGGEEHKRRMEEVERLLPDTLFLRRSFTFACFVDIAGIVLYCCALLSLYKGWLGYGVVFKLFVLAAFLFITGGFFAYHVNNKLTSTMRSIGEYLRSIYESQGYRET